MANTFFRVMGISGWLSLVTAFFITTAYDPNNNGYHLLYWTLFLLIVTVGVARTEGKLWHLFVQLKHKLTGAN